LDSGDQMTLLDPDHIPPTPGRPLRHPLTAAAVVIYGTLMLLALTVPRGLLNWSRDLDPSGPQRLMLTGAQAVQTFARASGADWPYYRARDAFLKATGKSED
jgi:hypothetical protein